MEQGAGGHGVSSETLPGGQLGGGPGGQKPAPAQFQSLSHPLQSVDPHARGAGPLRPVAAGCAFHVIRPPVPAASSHRFHGDWSGAVGRRVAALGDVTTLAELGDEPGDLGP